MVERSEAPSFVLAGYFREVSPRVLGAVGLAAGAISLELVILGASSWMPLATALVVWILSGWALFFVPRPRQPAVAALGSFLLLSATAVAGAVLLGLYLIMLGPSWKL